MKNIYGINVIPATVNFVDSFDWVKQDVPFRVPNVVGGNNFLLV